MPGEDADVSEHASTEALLAIATGGGAADDGHVAGCLECAELLRLLHEACGAAKDERAVDECVDPVYPSLGSRAERDTVLLRFRTSAEIAHGLGHVAAEADRASDAILAAIPQGVTSIRRALRDAENGPAGSLAVVHACQKAARLVPKDPRGCRTAAALVLEGPAPSPATPLVARAVVEAEALLLDAQALTVVGDYAAARVQIREARRRFEDVRDAGFSLALCDYFEASAAGFVGDHAFAETALTNARAVFAEFGQAHWEGRALAAFATSLGQRGEDDAAEPLFDEALAKLDPVLDLNAHLQTRINKAVSQARSGRADAARRTYADALRTALREGMLVQTQMIRVGLAEIEFRDGRLEQALHSFAGLERTARLQGFAEDVVLMKVYQAECLARLGREDEMRDVLEALRVERGGLDDASLPAIEDLLRVFDEGDANADVLRWVREYLANPVVDYLPFRRRA